jgi:hypothetical protein
MARKFARLIEAARPLSARVQRNRYDTVRDLQQLLPASAHHRCEPG